MSNYRRNRVPGGTYFFTAALLDRTSDLLVAEIAILRQAVRQTHTRMPFHIDAWVVLPEHIHCIWTLPPGDDDYTGRWRALKKAFSKAIPKNEALSAVRAQRGERGIWQRRYWEHTIRNEHDYATHMDYIHFNPVKHGYVDHPRDWPFSTFQRCVADGLYPADWSSGDAEPPYSGEPET